DRLQLFVLATALRVGAGAADAVAARPREREDEGASLRDPDADGAVVDLRGRDLQSVGRREQQPACVLALPGSGDGDLVRLDGVALRRHLPRQARISREV